MPTVPSQKFANMFRAGHHAWRRCSSVEYCLYAPLSRLVSRAPRAGTFVRELLTRDTGQRLVCLGVFVLGCTALAPGAFAQGGADIPRTPSGRPDLSGNYDTVTVTPLQRSRQFGNRATLTAEEVAIIASDPDGLAHTFNLAPAGSDERAAVRADAQVAGFETGDGSREAPPAGGDGSAGAVGNVGGYNTFWIDRGKAGFQIDGEYRTSIIIDPPAIDSRRGHPKTGRLRRHGGGLSGRTAGPRGGSRTT